MTASLIIRSTANPGQRVTINMPGGDTDGILCMSAGGWSDTPIGDGRMQTTFRAEAQKFPVNLRKAVNNMDELFTRAQQVTASGSADDLIVIEVRTKGESTSRFARVYGGRVSAVDNQVVNASLERNAGIFDITLERDELWKLSGETVDQTWTAIKGYGGYRTLGTAITAGTAPGHIELMRIDPKSGRMAEAWVGIKPNLVGGLDEFDPVVAISTSNAGDEKCFVWNINSVNNADISDKFINGVGTRVRWRTRDTSDKQLAAADVAKNIASQEMVYGPLRAWNAGAMTPANRKQYIGKYRVLLRWAGDLHSTGRYAFRLTTGWAGGGNANNPQTTMAPVYKRAPGDLEFHFVQLGTVTVGGSLYGAAAQRRNIIDSFTLGLDVAIMGLDQDDSKFVERVAGATLYIDKLILIPAEASFHARYEHGEIVPGYQMEYQSVSPGESAVFVTTNYDSVADWLGGEGQVIAGIAEYDVNDFVMPTEDGSVLVLVTDRPWGQTQDLTANRLVSLAVTKRARNYAD